MSGTASDPNGASQPPVLPSPAGFGQPDVTHNGQILAGTGVTTFLALVFVIGRIWVRLVKVRSIGGDDYWILAALFLSLLGYGIIIPAVKYGGGRHVYHILNAVGPEGLIIGLKLNFVTQFTYVFALTCTKISIGIFLIRLTPPGSVYQRLIWGIIGFVAFYTIAGSAALLSGCKPFAANFDRSIPGAKCYNVRTSQALAFTNSSLGIVTDLIFAVLPIPLLWTLQVNRRVKLGILGILSLGLFAASASIVKVYYLTSYGAFGDFLWDSTYLTIWSATEVNVAIIASSFPALKPLFKTILGSTYGKNSFGYPPRTNYAQQSSAGPTDRSRPSKSQTGKAEAFEMRSSISGAMRSGRSDRDRERNKLGFNISEESILPLHNNSSGEGTGIVKTMQVSIKSTPADEGQPRSVEDRV